jgi:ABC-type polysaccharide/polyol phosphate transport system ATPase subunit
MAKSNKPGQFIEFTNVSKSFLRHTTRLLLRSHLKAFFQRAHKDRFYALKNISFRIQHGENVAIVGANGAGKSTLLSLVASLAVPDDGSVQVSGRIAALLELGSGFHPDLTGRENVFLNGSLLGLSKKAAIQTYDAVVEFSEIGDFIDEPLRTYSSGMMLRLAFSVAVNMNPDFLIVDEVLAVGDQKFQAKCFDKIAELKRNGKSLLSVSHSAPVIRELCERALWLDHGELIADGKTEDILKMYEGHHNQETPPNASVALREPFQR